MGPQFGDRQVEGRMPLYWYAPILEMQTGASPAMVMLWCLTQGATTVLQYNLSKELQERFLPKMYSGEWGGSMCHDRSQRNFRSVSGFYQVLT